MSVTASDDDGQQALSHDTGDRSFVDTATDATTSRSFPGTAGGGGELSCRLVTRQEDFDALASDWQRLTEADSATGVFNGWAWNHAWWSHYGSLGTLHVLVLSADGVVCGIAPFYRTRSQVLRLLKLPTLRMLGNGGDTSPDDLDVLSTMHWRERVVECVVQQLFDGSGCTRFDLQDIPAESAFLAQIETVATARGYVLPQTHTLTRAVDTLPPDVDAWRASLSRNARKQLKRRRNRLSDIRAVRFHTCTSSDEVDEAHGALVRLHQARRASLGETGSFRSPAYRDFHHVLMMALLARGELRLGVLSFDEEIVAVEYAFEVHGTLAFFQSGFDPSQALMAPSHLLMHHMIEEAIQSGTCRIDLLKGEYAYKRGFASATQTTRSIDLFKQHAVARGVASLRRAKASVLGWSAAVRRG